MDEDMTYVPIYVFALEFIQTAVTTVGFGSHTYGTNAEIMYVCLIEVISAVYTASLITLAAKIETLLSSNSFFSQVQDHMDKRDEWLFYKVQKLGRPYYLSSTLSKQI